MRHWMDPEQRRYKTGMLSQVRFWRSEACRRDQAAARLISSLLRSSVSSCSRDIARSSVTRHAREKLNLLQFSQPPSDIGRLKG